jgi:hypothetical protein
MGRLMQILGVILALALVYAVMAGLGLTQGFKHRKTTLKTEVINDFEDPTDDFDWTTGGYVKIEPSTENKTHGKYCAKATFLLAGQFMPNMTPSYPVTPAAGSSQAALAIASSQAATASTPELTPTPSVSWRPEMILDVNSVTPLKVLEWQEYADLKMDVFNDQTQPVTCHIQVGDSHAYLYNHPEPLTPKKVTNISIPLQDLIANRLDLTNIRSLRFWVDTAGATQPVVVYLDYIRLEGDATAPKSANPSTTPTPHR